MSRSKEPRGYRWKSVPGARPAPPKELQPEFSLTDSIIGADALARIATWAASQAPPPEPEDLLVMWAQEYYHGGGDFFIWQIGMYVAEDLKLRGLVWDSRKE